METLKNMLFEAAAKGNVNSLKKLLQEDPIILDRALVNSFSDTPIHVAAILGHSDFVKEILSRRPEFARELNLCQSSPLHLASAKGYIEVVRVLLSANPLMCLARDRNGLTPLHLAGIKGQVEVVEELFEAKREAARVIVGQGQTILHLCVKYYQIEALKFLVNAIGDKDFTKWEDSDGNTILHLAVADKQVETINFLLTECATEVNAKNLGGMTAMDVLNRGRRDVRDEEEIEESLKRAGAVGSIENNSMVQINRNVEKSSIEQKENRLEKKRKEKRLEEKRNALMVVASLIATMAFQVGVNPPGGVWQDTNTVDSKGNPVKVRYPHRAGESIYASNDRTEYGLFMISNATGLIASLSIILLLVSGLPMRRIFVWILMVITWIAISAVALTYLLSVSALTPDEKEIIGVVNCTTFIWLGLMVLLLIGHTIRMISKLRKCLSQEKTTGSSGIRMIRKLMKCLSQEETTGSSGITSHHTV